jgi:regulator of sigma E protease
MLGETVHEGFREGARIGVISTLELLAFISLSLFLTNLLPVPVLDGGIILFAIIELVTRRKLNPKLLYYIQMVGIAIVGAIIVLALVGDIRYFIIGSLAK